MSAYTTETLSRAKCTPCEGGTEALPRLTITSHLQLLDGWALSADGKSIEKRWKCKNFVEAMKLANLIGDLAEHEQHHPDLHVTGYRELRVVLTTHAIGGLSDNDFIIAAKIDKLDLTGKS